MDENGNFVVVWASHDQDGDNWGIYGRRYDASGLALGSEFLVNTTTTKEQEFPSVAADAAGNFVVTWSSKDQDGDNYGVYARLYDASGTPGSEFLVNTTTLREQEYSSVSMDADGDFVITWTSNNQDGTGRGVYARQYTAAGVAKTGEMLVNTTTAGDQEYSSVSMNGRGDFVVTWNGNGPGDNQGVFAQQYTVVNGLTFVSGDGMRDTSMTFRGTVAQINTVLDGLKFAPDIGFNGLATVTITTSDLGNTGSGGAAIRRRYDQYQCRDGERRADDLRDGWNSLVRRERRRNGHRRRRDRERCGFRGLQQWAAGRLLQRQRHRQRSPHDRRSGDRRRTDRSLGFERHLQLRFRRSRHRHLRGRNRWCRSLDDLLQFQRNRRGGASRGTDHLVSKRFRRSRDADANRRVHPRRRRRRIELRVTRHRDHGGERCSGQ